MTSMETLVDWIYEGPIIFPECGIFYSPNVLSVTPSSVLNPNANEFEVKPTNNEPNSNVHICWEHNHSHHADFHGPISPDGYVYMNGDLGKLPSGAVFTSSSATPDQTAVGVAAIQECSSASAMVNGEVESGGGCYNSPPPSSLGGGANSPAANVMTVQDSTIPLDQLKQMLSSQLEYYFSRENLANDTYLLSQMDNDQYVPIWTVANFNQVKKLTKDINLITEVLRESPNVQVDEEGVKVRPNHKRCIVILREIPDNTPIEEVKNLFSGENCPRLISCEFALNSSWYVTFETDDDAQRAYRFLREEVREFQGKPITARIKAKPMHRMPLPPVANVKNGYRNTPPVAATYDPTTVAYPAAQQRFVYANGAPPQSGYGSQMHVYQYYAPNMLQAWPAAPAAPYYDIGSVFAVNGLSPQSSFKQVAGPRYQPRPRNKRNSVPLQNETRQHVQPPPPSSPQARPTVKNLVCAVTGPAQTVGQESNDVSTALVGQNSGQPTVIRPESDDGCSLQYRQSIGLPLSNKETNSLSRHRTSRRRRDEELAPTSPQPPPSMLAKDPVSHRNNSAHFDLEASAFPPLPGIDTTTTVVHTNVPKQAVPQVAETVVPTQPEVIQAQWGESRLADVVKGTARPKSSSTKDKEVIQNNESITHIEAPLLAGPGNVTSPVTSIECKDTATGSSDVSVSLTNTVTSTPPFSPDKLVPLQTIKCTMADKSTKTDESLLLNGDVCESACPTTTNAATMTVIVTTEASPRQTTVSMTAASAQRPQTPPQASSQSIDNGPPRMSYAQVAQHHKERLMRERQNSGGEQPIKEKVPPPSTQSRVAQQEIREHKESRGNARRSSKSTRASQGNNHTNLKVQTSPNRATSPNQSAESNIQHQSSVQTDGIIDNNETVQQRDGGQVRYNSSGRGTGRSYERVQSGGPGRRRSGLDQRPQFREFLGNRSPK